MIFLTVGTEYPFDRLVRFIDKMAGAGELFDSVFAQIGSSKYHPQHMEWIEIMQRSEYEQHMKNSSAIIAHAGMGTIIQCMELNKPLLVMPRNPAYGEIVSDHQIGTTIKFAERGDLLVAKDETELPTRIAELKDFRPPVRSIENSMISQHIITFLDELESKQRK